MRMRGTLGRKDIEFASEEGKKNTEGIENSSAPYVYGLAVVLHGK